MDKFGNLMRKVTGRKSEISPPASSTQGKETGGPARRKSLQLASDKTKESWGLKPKIPREAGYVPKPKSASESDIDLDATEVDRASNTHTKKGNEVARERHLSGTELHRTLPIVDTFSQYNISFSDIKAETIQFATNWVRISSDRVQKGKDTAKLPYFEERYSKMKAMYDKTLQEMQGFENLWHTGERDLASNKWEQWVQTSQSDQPDADIATLITNNIGSQILGERARQGSLVGIITSQEVPEEIDMSRIHPPKDLWDCHEQRARAHWERIIQKDYGGVFEGLQGEDALNRFYSRVESHTQSLIENAKVFRRVRTMALYEVLKNGDKKLPTTGPSTIRNHLKNQAMYGSSEAPTDAYMSDSDSGVLPPKETEDYGAITVRLKKDRVMKRATLAFDDTGSHYWHAENELTVIPRPADRLGIEVWPLTRMRNFWGILNEVELSQDQNPLAVRRISDLENYVEVEVHKKGLEIGDIEKVYLPSPDHQEEEEKAALSEITKQLDECNIEWEYLNA